MLLSLASLESSELESLGGVHTSASLKFVEEDACKGKIANVFSLCATMWRKDQGRQTVSSSAPANHSVTHT